MSTITQLPKIAQLSAPVRLLIFIGVLFIVWLPLAIPIYLLLQEDANLASIITMGLLFVQLLWMWKLWGKYIYRDRHIFTRYGLVTSKKNAQEFLKGLAIGFWFCLGLFIIEAGAGWLAVTPPTVSLFKIVAEGLISALGIGLAEELLFRGWLLDELQRDYSRKTCLGVGAVIFALAHFLKPLTEIIRTAVTFPALILLGITLIIAKNQHGDRLGICIGIHAGLVWGYYIVNVGKLINYTQQVPVWVTGIDGNPIAGVMGLLFLTGLMYLVKSLRLNY
ncbi:abortive infection protein [Chondrocystis sp. NIES-4102]|nr:abortive infection protein [Chondrocystis sp. NIES-4102]